MGWIYSSNTAKPKLSCSLMQMRGEIYTTTWTHQYQIIYKGMKRQIKGFVFK